MDIVNQDQEQKIVSFSWEEIFFAKLSPGQPANLQLSWAEIALIPQLKGTTQQPTTHQPQRIVVWSFTK